MPQRKRRPARRAAGPVRRQAKRPSRGVRAAPESPHGPEPGSEEARLLRVARELTGHAAASRSPADVVATAVAQLTPPAPVAGPRERARALALAWAREQARLALAEALGRAARAGTARADVPIDTLAWLVLAGCEAVVRESPDAAADRAHALTVFVAGVPRGSAGAAR